MMLIDWAIVANRNTSVIARSQYPFSKNPPTIVARSRVAITAQPSKAVRSGPDFGIKALTEQPAWAEHENREQHAETDCVAITGVEQDRGEAFDNAEDYPGDHGPWNTTEATEHDNDERLHRVGVAQYGGKSEA